MASSTLDMMFISLSTRLTGLNTTKLLPLIMHYARFVPTVNQHKIFVIKFDCFIRVFTCPKLLFVSTLAMVLWYYAIQMMSQFHVDMHPCTYVEPRNFIVCHQILDHRGLETRLV